MNHPKSVLLIALGVLTAFYPPAAMADTYTEHCDKVEELSSAKIRLDIAVLVNGRPYKRATNYLLVKPGSVTLEVASVGFGVNVQRYHGFGAKTTFEVDGAKIDGIPVEIGVVAISVLDINSIEWKGFVTAEGRLFRACITRSMSLGRP